jgi:acylaminoacyl-peptidase
MECALENADFWRWFRGEHQPLGDGGRSDNENDGSGTSSGRWYPQWSAIDRRRVGVVGGSHGGFLGAHLSAVRPSVVRAVVLRNPVVDIATMVSQTDIADWCYHECGIEIGLERGVERSTSDSNDGIGDASASSTPGNIHRVPQLAELERMRLCSPISHADRVRAATLLQIGGQDQRVPCSQGFQWARAIRTQAEALRVLFYPRSNHAIEDSPSFDDAWIQCLAWLLKFLPASNADDADDHVRGSASRPA